MTSLVDIYRLADDIVKYFSYFSRKQDLTFHANCLQYMKCHAMFSGLNKYNITIFSSAELAKGVIKVKWTGYT